MPAASNPLHHSYRVLKLLARNIAGLPRSQIALLLQLPVSATQAALDSLLDDGMIRCTKSRHGIKGNRNFYHPSAQGLRYLQSHMTKEKAVQIDSELELETFSNHVPAPRGKLTSHLESYLTGENALR